MLIGALIRIKQVNQFRLLYFYLHVNLPAHAHCLIALIYRFHIMRLFASRYLTQLNKTSLSVSGIIFYLLVNLPVHTHCYLTQLNKTSLSVSGISIVSIDFDPYIKKFRFTLTLW